MKMDLKVPFAEKDAAKKLGARWDAARKLWYVEDKLDLAPFAKWAPTLRADSVGGASGQVPAAGARQVSTGKAMLGSAYVAHPSVCACPPWELCDQCRPFALASGL